MKSNYLLIILMFSFFKWIEIFIKNDLQSFSMNLSIWWQFWEKSISTAILTSLLSGKNVKSSFDCFQCIFPLFSRQQMMFQLFGDTFSSNLRWFLQKSLLSWNHWFGGISLFPLKQVESLNSLIIYQRHWPNHQNLP